MQSAEISSPAAPSVNISSRSKAPVFVLGSPRSGTTLLYHMLLSAGNFAIYRAESQVFNLLEPRFGDLSVPQHRKNLLEAWLKTRLFTATGLDAQGLQHEVEARCGNAGDFLRIVMSAMARNQKVDRWADCTPEHLLYVRRIKATIPDALVVHIIRDGRDVALSMARQHWIRPFPWDRGRDLAAAASYWKWIVSRGAQDGRELGGDYLEVRFEDLVTDPRATLAKVGQFVDQDLNYDRILEAGVGSVSEPNTSFEQGDDGKFSPVERWKKSMPADQLSLVQGAIGDLLVRLGYQLGDVPRAGSARAALYQQYFDAKFFLKARTPMGRYLVTKDLSWV
jgi:hypothetical protein